MQLPKNILSPDTYTKPRCFLCQPDKTKIGELEVYNLNGTFKLNSYSEISFDVGRYYSDLLNGGKIINPYYEKILTPRLILLEGFGYFEIQGCEVTGDGIQEIKNVTAYSLEYTLSYKYLEDFYVGTGETQSIEYINAVGTIVPVTLYNTGNEKLSLLHLILEKAYGWTIGHVDEQLKKESRSFEVERESIYDFIINEICEKFNCYAQFDTFNNTINLYAESDVRRFIGDGSTKTFIISPPFYEIGTVAEDGYKTIAWQYNKNTGELTFDTAPEQGAKIEVVDGSLAKWETDVFVSFENLAQEVKVNYDADSIKTVLTVTYGDGEDIRDSNLGLPYLVDLSYYHSVDWMGQDLYDKYTAYLQSINSMRIKYEENSRKLIEIDNYRTYEQQRLSLGYVESSVTADTVGDDYYIRGGDSPNFYYTQVSLPADYKTDTQYYRIDGANLAEEKVANLYYALAKYYSGIDTDDTSGAITIYSWITALSSLEDDFSFMDTNAAFSTTTSAIEYLKEKLNLVSEIDDRFADGTVKFITDGVTKNFTLPKLATKTLYILMDGNMVADTDYAISSIDNALTITFNDAPLEDQIMVVYYETALDVFLEVMWNEVGATPLKQLYYTSYKLKQDTHIEAGYSERNNSQYGLYYTDVVFINSINKAIRQRDEKIAQYDEEYNTIQAANNEICKNALLDQYFSKDDLVTLSAFLREDELQLDDIITTDQDTTEDAFATKQDAIAAGRIELSKRCQPQLQFSMTMANIYALSEFEPIIDQFQLGKVIKIAIRPDYIKQSRILQVNINFDDFNDFSCEFGDLTDVRTQSDIHADLLKQAVQAGKSVATNASYWTKGSDTSNSIDLRLQQGLLDSIEALKSVDVQNAYMDKYGIHLEAVDPDTGQISDNRVWMVNNKIIFTDDGFKTTKTVLGEFTVDNTTYYGLLAQAVISGYIEGSQIRGGTIQIGEQDDGSYAFQVNEDGSVQMNGYAAQSSVDNLQSNVNSIQSDVNSINNDLEQHFDFSPSQGLKILQGEGQKTYVQLSGEEMGFYTSDNNESSQDAVKVVSIGNNAATIKNLTVNDSASFIGNTKFDSSLEITNSQVSPTPNFVFQVEADGSLTIG